jgi:asparagine synthase (glutamine-hydrolysing)
MLECAAGGTLLTGVGGDELWAASSAPRIGLRRRVLRRAPHPLRRMLLARREPIQYPWLRPAALDAAKRAAGGDSAAEPSTVGARMRWWRGMRSTAVGTAALDLIAGDAGAEIRHPLLDNELWGAVAAAAPRAGFGDRKGALSLAAGHLLPSDVVSRRTKAGFDAVFFREYARALACDWAGGGVPDELVDTASLRAHWRAGEPDPHSFTLLQAAWLASAGDGIEQPLGRGVQ